MVTTTVIIHIGSSDKQLNQKKPNGHYIYRQFNIQQLYHLPTPCIYVFCVDLRRWHAITQLFKTSGYNAGSSSYEIIRIFY